MAVIKGYPTAPCSGRDGDACLSHTVGNVINTNLLSLLLGYAKLLSTVKTAQHDTTALSQPYGSQRVASTVQSTPPQILNMFHSDNFCHYWL